MGAAYQSAVKNLEEMGFEKDQIKAAMKAAFNNPDRAVEYLMNVSKMQKQTDTVFYKDCVCFFEREFRGDDLV